jgi:hypothetical protein
MPSPVQINLAIMTGAEPVKLFGIEGPDSAWEGWPSDDLLFRSRPPRSSRRQETRKHAAMTPEQPDDRPAHPQGPSPRYKRKAKRAQARAERELTAPRARPLPPLPGGSDDQTWHDAFVAAVRQRAGVQARAT